MGAGNMIMRVVAAASACALAIGLVACGGQGGNSGDVAATVNGHDIMESEVTEVIESMRTTYGATDEEAWGTLLAQSGYTSESLREQVIDGMVDDELKKEGAESVGVSVDEAEVENYLQKMRDLYDDDAAWKDALDAVGLTEETYADNIRLSLLDQKLLEYFEAEAEVSDEEVATLVPTYAEMYDGGKRSSHILFDADDRETAEQVLADLRDGKVEFAEAAEQHSTDSSSEDGGDVGWDKATQFVDEYQSALDGLSKGEMSDLVESEFGIHIIMCTDEYEAPEDPKELSDLPDDVAEMLETMLKQQAASQAEQEWLDEMRETADIEVKEMPEGLPYAVDVSKYAADESSEDQGTSSSSGDTVVNVDEDGNVEVQGEQDDGASTDATASGEAQDASGSEGAGQ